MDAGPANVGILEHAELEGSEIPSAPAQVASPQEEIPVGPDSPILAIMSTARAMRHLAPDPVPDELIHSLIEAASWAPTGGNAQGEAFVVVTDPETKARLAALWRRVVDDYRLLMEAAIPGIGSNPSTAKVRESVNYQRDHFAETPAIIVACYDQRAMRGRARSPLRTAIAAARKGGLRRTAGVFRAWPTIAQRSEAASIYPAVENLLLAARANGLAACLTTWHLLAEAEFKEVLGIPKDVKTFAVIPVGWPLRRFGPVKRGPVESVIHRERW